MKRTIIVLIISLNLQGCVAIALVDLAAATVVKTVGLAVDGVVGTAKLVGGVFVPDSDNE
jgi:hypothetical protein